MSYARRFIGAENLPMYEHQVWARTHLGPQVLDDTGVDQLQAVLAVAALEAAHPNDLADTARMWLFERPIVIPGPRRVADWARVAFDATEAEMAATIEAGLGKAALLKAVDLSAARSRSAPTTGQARRRWEGCQAAPVR